MSDGVMSAPSIWTTLAPESAPWTYSSTSLLTHLRRRHAGREQQGTEPLTTLRERNGAEHLAR